MRFFINVTPAPAYLYGSFTIPIYLKFLANINRELNSNKQWRVRLTLIYNLIFNFNKNFGYCSSFEKSGKIISCYYSILFSRV